MTGQSTNSNIKHTVITIAVLLIIGCTAITLGLRSDAASVAHEIKSGILTADEVAIAFENVSGRLISHQIKESDLVTAGQELMQLDPTDIEISIAVLNAQISSLKAQLAQTEQNYIISTAQTDLDEKSQWFNIELLAAAKNSAQESLDLAKTEYLRAQNLMHKQAVSQSTLDQAKAEFVQAQAESVRAVRELNAATIGASAEQMDKLLNSGSAQGMNLTSINNARLSNENLKNQIADLKAQISADKAQLRQLKVNLDRLTLRAREPGKILQVLFEDGELIQAGATAVLLETDRKYFDIYVSEDQVGKYRPGTKVTAYAPAIDKNITGTVRFATAAPAFADLRNTRERGQSDLTSYQIRIYTDPEAELLTGMTLEVK